MPPRPTGFGISAVSISSRIRPLLDRSPRGAVLATFARSCYLDLDGHLVAVVATELLDGPLNLVLALPSTTRLDEAPVGAPVSCRGGTLDIAEAWQIDFAHAPIWNARVTPLTVTPHLRLWLASIRRILDAEAPVESLARPARVRRASEGMDLLEDGLRHRDVTVVREAADTLVGLGPGLTPSGDDVLAGTLLAIALLRPVEEDHWRQAIIDASRGRTIRISEAYLEAAAAGEAGEAWHHLRRTLQHAAQSVPPASDEDPDLRAAVRGVLAFGETSGADMLAGFVLGMDALLPG